MKHSIISWDSSFRNFFHLIPSLACQDFNKDQFEVIYVEQRSQEVADRYNHNLGLRSLSDLKTEYGDKLNIRIIYLNNSTDIPYHLGKCVNAGLRVAQGEFINIMDGDTLVPNNFLQILTNEQEKEHQIFNLFRHMAEHPVDVTSFSEWKSATVSINKCLNASFTKYSKLPKHYSNCGPLISASRDFWTEIGGYDESDFWATSASTLGGDANRRLELVSGKRSLRLPDCFCVHPWHPIGYARKSRKDKVQLFKDYVAIQYNSSNWSIANKLANEKDRRVYNNSLSKKYESLINQVCEEERLDILSGQKEVNDNSILDFRKKSGLSLATTNVIGLAFYRILSKVNYF